MINITEFKKYLSLLEITTLKGRGTELITLSVPKTTPLHEVSAKIRFEKNECRSIKSKKTKTALEDSLEAISSFLNKEGLRKDFSTIIFSGIVNEKLYFNYFYSKGGLPYRYYCSDRFNTSDYYQGLETKKYYLLILDLNGATVGSKSSQGLQVLKNFDSYIPSKTKKGGQSARRYSQIRVNETRELFGKIASYCEDLDRIEPRPFLMGGSPPTIDYFLKDKHLSPHIKNKASGPYYLQTDNQAGLEELVFFSKDSEIIREKEEQEFYLKKPNYPIRSMELKNLIFLVPFSFLEKKEELRLINEATSNCEVLIIHDYTSLGAEFNDLKKIRIIPR